MQIRIMHSSIIPASSRLAAILLLANLIVTGWTTSHLMAADAAAVARPPWTTSRINGTPSPPAPYRVELAFPGVRFKTPTSITEIPSASVFLITERDGCIYTFANNQDVEDRNLVADLRQSLAPELLDKPLSIYGATVHPKFASNRFLYVCYTHPADGEQSRVSRFEMTAQAPYRLVDGSEQILITWPAGGHNGGCLRFGNDGHLYISTGDGWGPNPPDFKKTAQDVSNLMGAILRIDVDHPAQDKPYGIPDDNPFLELPSARPEIWSYGLRNPWKFGIDRVTGNIFVADNGWETWESIHQIVRGGNCGWPIREGRAALRSDVQQGPTPIRPPIKDHPHTEANSVIGGPVYRGKTMPDLAGYFVYGDYITGTIWGLRANAEGDLEHLTLVDTDLRIVSFTEGSSGDLYVLDYDLTGQIYRLLPSDVPDTSANFPRRLSETGLFSSLSPLQPAAGVIPYDVTAGRWLDGAQAARWIAIPDRDRVQLSRDLQTQSSFPENTVLVKHLTWSATAGQPSRPLETQLLHRFGGTWNPYSYRWTADGQDALLVPPEGSTETISLAAVAPATGQQERSWHVGAENECRMCHNAGSHYVLGFVPHQLNLPLTTTNSDRSGQLARLATQGVIERDAPVPAQHPLRLVNPHDVSQPLEDRARSYLHANCSSCHHPGGNAIVSFYLRRDLSLDQLNAFKGTGIGTFGIDDARLLVPGDPYRSLILYRMSKLGYARMPYIGSRAVDSQGVALVAAWISSLAPGQALAGPAKPGSPEQQALEVLDPQGDANPAQRRQAIDALLASTPGALSLITQLHGAQLAPPDRSLAVRLGSQATRGDIAGLFEEFIPESQRLARLGQKIDPATILSLTGNAPRGRLIYFSDNARCRHCHHVDEPGQSLGPTLQEINRKFPRRGEFLQQILQPSLKIDEKFRARVIVTTEGRLHTGLLERESPQEIVLRTAEKKKLTIVRDDIDELQISPLSLMPQFLLSDLTAQQAADLLAYLQSLGAAPPPRKPTP